MLDLHYILDNLEEVKKNTHERNMPVDMERFAQLAEQRRELIQQVDSTRQRQNEIAHQMKDKSLTKEDRMPLIEEGRTLKTNVSDLESKLEETQAQLLELQIQIPNLTHPDVPHGATDEQNKALKYWGEPTKFDFPTLDHVELSDKLGLIEWERGSKVTGSKFYFLRGDAVWLELALIRYALGILEEEGFIVHTTPDMARKTILENIGFNPRREATQIYSIENTDLALIATAEITLGGMYQDEIFSEEELPLKIAGISHCFRTEAGAPGRASRGLYRVHQFTKVEMFAFTTPEQSNNTLEDFLRIEEKIFQGLGVPYQVVDCCRGDLGAQAYRKYDIEAWMPGRGEEGKYGEVTSTSNCTDYQARRLKTRFRREGQKKPLMAHTLNGTAIATSRGIISILENYQQADGSVVVPEVLRQWMGKDKIVPQ
ncbi:MAG TPA: serine--tRNA ligase [Myxococcales bacterium]|nr:serine--tRNA ligase [Myxococcales bacterium]